MNSVGKKILSLILSTAIVFGIVSCGTDPVGGDDAGQGVTLVTNVVAPTSMVVTVGKTQNIQAAGANKESDVIVISNADYTYECAVTATTSKYVQFRVPSDIVDGTYTFSLKRGDQIQELFTVKVQVQAVDTTVKDKMGYNLKGMVYCEGVGVKGVLVSDGINITETDENGHYWLNSNKSYEVVYVILPKGYDIKSKSALPEFWAATSLDTSSKVQEQNNFELVKNTTNTNHTVLVVTDIHIANLGRYPNDYVQFNQGWKAEVIKDYTGKSNVYCLNLGDFAWDVHWYASKYAIPEAASEVSGLPFQYWSTMGNHDNDGHAQGEGVDIDMLASRPYRQNLGPTHYSLNIGDVHYIMLDDILYRNSYPGETVGDPQMGMRDYKAGFREDIMEWLRQDLSYVSKNTPILVGMHIPICNWNGSGYNGEFASKEQWTAFLNLFSEFNEVEFISGHTHVNRMRSIPGFGNNMYEHNIAAICGIWWHTSLYTGGTTSKLGALNLCADGAPAGYYVYDVQGKSRSWRYKSVGVHKDKQFKTYDMNEVKKFYTTNTDAQSYVSAGETGNISTSKGTKLTVTKSSLGLLEPENMVWLNVWGHETGKFASYGEWSITVKENGKTLNVEKITGYRDPLAVACYDVPQLAKSGVLGDSRAKNDHTHFFRVQATSATSTLEITVKDRFGNTYTETMKRPKKFYTDSGSDVWTLE